MNLYSSSNLSTTYFPNNFQQKYPFNSCNTSSPIESVCPNKPFEIVKNGNLIGYFWHQGNSIDLVFDITGTITSQETDNYIDVVDIANSLCFEAYFYDFRGIKILEYTNYTISENHLIVDVIGVQDSEDSDNAKITVTIPINAEVSSKLVKGVYRMDLTVSHPSGYRETIFSGDQIVFEVR